MATIQVRDISEETYEVIRRRARSSGQSIQAYMKREVERLAREPTDDEIFAQIDGFISDHGVELRPDGLLADIDADRR